MKSYEVWDEKDHYINGETVLQAQRPETEIFDGCNMYNQSDQ